MARSATPPGPGTCAAVCARRGHSRRSEIACRIRLLKNRVHLSASDGAVRRARGVDARSRLPPGLPFPAASAASARCPDRKVATLDHSVPDATREPGLGAVRPPPGLSGTGPDAGDGLATTVGDNRLADRTGSIP